MVSGALYLEGSVSVFRTRFAKCEKDRTQGDRDVTQKDMKRQELAWGGVGLCVLGQRMLI